MEEKKKKGFFSSLFAPKPCSCGVQLEEVPTTENSGEKMSDKKDDKASENKAQQQNNQVERGCGC